ncbi:unnamed protein product [Amoebophrya sp. A25]|nr:unnamed protein product [Amoebophrya sp. A25]|eukprot:GSA25T00002769001.1
MTLCPYFWFLALGALWQNMGMGGAVGLVAAGVYGAYYTRYCHNVPSVAVTATATSSETAKTSEAAASEAATSSTADDIATGAATTDAIKSRGQYCPPEAWTGSAWGLKERFFNSLWRAKEDIKGRIRSLFKRIGNAVSPAASTASAVAGKGAGTSGVGSVAPASSGTEPDTAGGTASASEVKPGGMKRKKPVMEL